MYNTLDCWYGVYFMLITNLSALRLQLKYYIDGSMQERCNSTANAQELRVSCTKPSIFTGHLHAELFGKTLTLKCWPVALPYVLSQITRSTGPIWGPPGSCRPQMGPMLSPWTVLSVILFIPEIIYTVRALLCFVLILWQTIRPLSLILSMHWSHIDGIEQGCSISSALAMEIL